jgi:aminopeptidase
LSNIKKHLDDMYIEYVHIKWDDADLSIKIWSDRKRLAWSGRNIPSFEVFTSPDWRETNWWMRFNQPLYVYWQLIKGIELHFKDWIITKFSAKENEAMLKSMIQTPWADKLGEFSLTDSRISHITTFMWEILYDENIWWEYGNTHVAIWNAYYDTYRWDVSKLNDEDIKRVWFNTSAEHTDIISTTNRTVTATLKDGSKKVIYKDGQFQFPID